MVKPAGDRLRATPLHKIRQALKIFSPLTRIIDLFRVGPLKILPPQTFRYAACGGLNMGLNLALYYLTYHYLLREGDLSLAVLGNIAPGGLPVVISPHIASGLIVFPIITLTGFLLNRHVAFRLSPLHGGVQFLRYVASVLGSLALYYVIMKLLVEYAHIWSTPSQAITISVTAVYSFMMQKHFSFRGSEKQ